MDHLTQDQLSALRDGALAGETRARAERHVAECASCRAALESLKAQDRELARTLEHDPGDAYFESFADRVVERLHAAEERAPERGGLGGWLARPRTLAWAGAAAAVVVGAGIVLVVARQSSVSSLRDRALESRASQVGGEAQNAPAPPAARRAPAANESGAGNAASPAAPEPRARVPAPATEALQAPPGEPSTPATDENFRREAAPALLKEQEKARADRVRRDARGEEKKLEAPGASGFARPPAEAAPKGAPPGAKSSVGATPSPAGNAATEARESGAVAPAPAPAHPLAKPKGTPFQAGAPEAAGSAAAPGAERGKHADDEAHAASPAAEKSASRALDREDALSAAGSRVCGQVRDAGGRPVAGAQVTIADRGLGTVTDADGRYCIAVAPGAHQLLVMAIGYEEWRSALTVGQEKATANATLHPVVVVGGPGFLALHGGRADGAAPDSFAGWPEAARSPARRAETLSKTAARDTTAGAFDAAASAWERAVKAAAGSDHEAAARARLADARYRAWELGPNAKRAQAATEALTAYLARAPLGPARDLAARRLNQLRH